MADFSKTRYLTGMRAYAAVGVLLIHAGGGGLRSLGAACDRFVNHLHYGVVVFFVLSAFTLAMSLDRRWEGYGSYLKRRFMRIAPLYYLLCGVCLFLPSGYWLTHFQVENNWWNLISHLTFLNLLDVSRINGLIGPEWTITIEMFFYLSLPLGFYLARTWRGTAALILLTYLFTLTIGPWTRLVAAGHLDDLHLARLWSPQSYAVAFLIGLLAFRLHRWRNAFSWLQKDWAFVAAAAALVAPIVLDAHWGHKAWVTWYSVLTALVILTSGGGNRLSRLVFENRAALYLGKISYSIYLVHMPILALLNPIVRSKVISFPVALLVTVGVASVTYHLVERPFTRLWRKEVSKARENPA